MEDTSRLAGNLFSVTGLVAVITGGGTGIGLNMAKALALNGAYKVYIIGRRKEVLEEAARSIKTNNVVALTADVTSKEDLTAVVEQIEREVGYVNLLINNAGTDGSLPPPLTSDATIEQFRDAFWATDPAGYLKTFEVNTVGPFYTTFALLKLLAQGNKQGNVKQHSQVIITTSVAAYSRGAPPHFAYSESKSGATHLVQHLATQLAPYQIRCNAFAPGLFPTEMSSRARPDVLEDPSFIPAGRTGTPEDIAGVTLFLASRAGSYVNGQSIAVDGGWMSVTLCSY